MKRKQSSTKICTECIHYSTKTNICKVINEEVYYCKVCDDFISTNDDLASVIKIIKEKYEYAKSKDYINNEIGYALYYTWRELEGGNK